MELLKQSIAQMKLGGQLSTLYGYLLHLPTKDGLSDLLQAIGLHAVLIRPLLPMYLHIILSAALPIYTSAHASLTRPSSAAKRVKSKSPDREDDDDEESEPKFEGLSATDAILFPVMAGATLAGLYYLIKLLEDPALLNKILNWYFSIFGVLTTARLLSDISSIFTSIVFPKIYSCSGHVWVVQTRPRNVTTDSLPHYSRRSPLPGRLAQLLPLPRSVVEAIWGVRDFVYQKINLNIYIHKLLKIAVKIGVQDIFGFALAIICELYFNLIAKPWWLTNILGFSFAYSSLQYISPTTASTGSLILAALFFYDIYFVFFTPMMVTVATKLDIPAKLMFPRPRHPADPEDFQPMSMLGLGDIVLPGILIAFALRFDLYLFYLRKQTGRSARQNDNVAHNESSKEPAKTEIVKAQWIPATGAWGERLWVGRGQSIPGHEGRFPKTYFHATLAGYVIGLVVTLLIMQVCEHAQPALLYLVPGVLGSLWFTAFRNDDLKTLWHFNEMEEENGSEAAAAKKKTDAKEADQALANGKTSGDTGSESAADKSKANWTNLSFFGALAERVTAGVEEIVMKDPPPPTSGSADVDDMRPDGQAKGERGGGKKTTKGKSETKPWDGQIFSVSLSVPRPKSGHPDVDPKSD